MRPGASWRYLPEDFPPWQAVYQQMRRWMAAELFEAMVHDLRSVLRMCAMREAEPTAAVFDGRTLQATPESGARAGYDGHKHKNGSKMHMAVDTLGHLLALCVTPANEQEREQVANLAERFSRRRVSRWSWRMSTVATPGIALRRLLNLKGFY
mgnify:CR=1 FL=1